MARPNTIGTHRLSRFALGRLIRRINLSKWHKILLCYRSTLSKKENHKNPYGQHKNHRTSRFGYVLTNLNVQTGVIREKVTIAAKSYSEIE